VTNAAERTPLRVLDGSILTNSRYPADFITSNLGIGINVVTAAHRTGVRRLLNLDSSCVYPREAPQLMRKFHEVKTAGAEEVVVWDSGRPRREFLHVDDAADACVFLTEQAEPPELVNVGMGRDLSIAELAGTIRDVVGFEGEITFDASKPDGTPRKLLDVSRMEAADWRARIRLRDGIATTCEWFLEHPGEVRA